MDQNQVGGATSDFDGKYKIKSITPGQYDLIASFIGYKNAKVMNITLVADSVKTVDFEMEYSSQDMGEFMITAYKTPLIQKDIITPTYIDGIQVRQSWNGAYDMKAKSPDYAYETDIKYQAGQLTASEINDFYKWEVRKATSKKKMQNLWQLYADNRYSFQVKSKNNKPVTDAVVELVGKSGAVLWKCRTDNTGKAEL